MILRVGCRSCSSFSPENLKIWSVNRCFDPGDMAKYLTEYEQYCLKLKVRSQTSKKNCLLTRLASATFSVAGPEEHDKLRVACLYFVINRGFCEH